MDYTYELVLNTNAKAGAEAFVSNLTSIAPDWHRSWGPDGCEVGSFTIQEHEDFAEALVVGFQSWLGYDVVEYSNGVKTWSGIVSRLRLYYKGVVRTRSLDDLANKVKVRYVDWQSNQCETDYASDTVSQGMFGVRVAVLEPGVTISEPSAEALRDRFLAQRAYPPTSVELGTPSDPIARLEVEVRGYNYVLQWMVCSQTSELDQHQVIPDWMEYGQNGDYWFSDSGQDFSDWETTSGPSKYSIWSIDNDGDVAWAYLGAAWYSNERIYVWQDIDRTTSGWNGNPAPFNRPQSYIVRGGVSRFISDVMGADVTEFVDVRKIDDNWLPFDRTGLEGRTVWDSVASAAMFGDSDGDPWQLYIDANRELTFRQTPTTPEYCIRNGRVYRLDAPMILANPWAVRPGVFRDLDRHQLGFESFSWLTDERDVFIRSVEVDAVGSLRLGVGSLELEQVFGDVVSQMPSPIEPIIPEPEPVEPGEPPEWWQDDWPWPWPYDEPPPSVGSPTEVPVTVSKKPKSRRRGKPKWWLLGHPPDWWQQGWGDIWPY